MKIAVKMGIFESEPWPEPVIDGADVINSTCIVFSRGETHSCMGNTFAMYCVTNSPIIIHERTSQL